jgi:hypothetical protein
MTVNFRTAALTGALASALAAGAALAGPSMAARASAMTHDLETCKQRGQAAAKKAQFKITKVLQFSVFAERDSYSVIVRCVPEQNTVFFVVAGPRLDRSTSYVEDIGNAF